MEQIVKFGIVGVVATVIDFGVLMLLSQVLHVNPVVAAAASYCISLVFNYLASMRFVFSHREGLSRRREFVTFVILSIVGLGLNEAIMAAGTLALGDSALMVAATKVCATAVVMVWNFVSRKLWLDGGNAS